GVYAPVEPGDNDLGPLAAADVADRRRGEDPRPEHPDPARRRAAAREPPHAPRPTAQSPAAAGPGADAAVARRDDDLLARVARQVRQHRRRLARAAEPLGEPALQALAPEHVEEGAVLAAVPPRVDRAQPQRPAA